MEAFHNRFPNMLETDVHLKKGSTAAFLLVPRLGCSTVFFAFTQSVKSGTHFCGCKHSPQKLKLQILTWFLLIFELCLQINTNHWLMKHQNFFNCDPRTGQSPSPFHTNEMCIKCNIPKVLSTLKTKCPKRSYLGYKYSIFI